MGNNASEMSKEREKLGKSFIMSRGANGLSVAMGRAPEISHKFTLSSKYHLSSSPDIELGQFGSNDGNFDKLVTCKSDIKKIYKIADQPIGEGFFGQVRLAKLPSFPSKIFAVKTIEKSKFKEDFSILANEVDNLKYLDHPNIILFYESYQDPVYFHIVVEYCSGGTLNALIDRKGGLDEGVARKFMKQIFWAISYIHSRGICNRDIKAENFLISSQGEDPQLKMIDFGLSSKFTIGEELCLSEAVGTPYYVAPEVLLQIYDERCDLWSAGVLMYYMLSGSHPFTCDTDEQLQKCIYNAKVTFNDDCWRNVSKDAKDLIRCLLQKDVTKRIRAAQSLDHKWFKLGIPQHINSNASIFTASQIIDHLNEFKAEKRFQKLVTSLMVNMLSELEIRHIRRMFREIDRDHVGVIGPKELEAFFEKHNHKPLISIEKIIEELKMKATQIGVLTYSEFIAAAIDKEFFLSKIKLRETFRYLDMDHSRQVTYHNIKELLLRQSAQLDDQEVEQMMAEIIPEKAANHQRWITLDEFLHIMSVKNLKRLNQLSENVLSRTRLSSVIMVKREPLYSGTKENNSLRGDKKPMDKPKNSEKDATIPDLDIPILLTSEYR